MYALGLAGLPAIVRINGVAYALERTVKHDFWAGTGFYVRPAGVADAPSLPPRVVVKINRRTSLLGLPLRWAGRRLRERERRAYETLRDLPNVPRLIDGDATDTGLIHAYVEGEPLHEGARVPDGFFAEFLAIVETMRERGIAYVDTNKPSNVLLGIDGRPHLFDFQISFNAARWWPPFLARGLLDLFYRGDVYHVLKLKRRFRPDQITADNVARLADGRPGQGLHRAILTPYRRVRRTVLGWMQQRGWVDAELSE